VVIGLKIRRLIIKTSSAKAKGRNLQNWVRDQIVKLFPELVNDIRSTPMGVTGTDIQLSPLAQGKIPLAIECKAQESVSIWAAYEQACEGAKLENEKITKSTGFITNPPKIEPVLILKRNRKAPLAVVDAEYFLQLMQDKYELGWRFCREMCS
jgi:hypothetical protein